ncbi:hypothetical protein ACO1PF_00510 [Alkalibacterium sp. f15]|uniref:hypothetical protein n=1 Tax=Alkalibacterium sp. f15 TaxID=3414029 RepID=UPI003BF7F121
MIITLAEAHEINRTLSKEDITGLEIAIRELTNNNFQNTRVRFSVKEIMDPDTIVLNQLPKGLRTGSRIELNNSDYNEELHTIHEIQGNVLKVSSGGFLDETKSGMIVTLVNYPQDVKNGVKKLIEYDMKTEKNIGVKSRSLSRVSETYFDVTSGENINGYPTSLFSFIMKYRKFRWGT